MEMSVPSAERIATGNVALLIDGENMSSTLAGRIMVQAGRQGELLIKRVYGNAAQLPGWQKAPGFLTVNTGVGKNSADMMLAIQAVDFASYSNVSCFVIASSDGDFSHLAHYLREKEFHVVGVGEAKAPACFRKSCNEFIELKKPASPVKVQQVIVDKATPEENAINQRIIQLIKEYPAAQGMKISLLGGKMHSQHKIKISARPDRTWRTYLVKRSDLFDCDPRGPDACVRLK